MSFFKKLFGGGSAPTEIGPVESTKREEYKGFMIAAAALQRRRAMAARGRHNKRDRRRDEGA